MSPDGVIFRRVVQPKEDAVVARAAEPQPQVRFMFGFSKVEAGTLSGEGSRYALPENGNTTRNSSACGGCFIDRYPSIFVTLCIYEDY
jgi:hypothetical protein